MDVKKMLDLCNKERAKVGAPALSHNDALCKVAEDHSKYMSSANQLTHDDPAGSLGTRFEKHGYSYTCAGESVAEGYSDEDSDAGFGRVGNYWTQDFGATNGSGGKGNS
ncbi:1162_t:CDS:2, partial [Racocetra persica]